MPVMWWTLGWMGDNDLKVRIPWCLPWTVKRLPDLRLNIGWTEPTSFKSGVFLHGVLCFHRPRHLLPPPPEKRKKLKKYPCATTFRSSRSHITVSFSFQSVKFVCKIRFRFRVWISLWHGTNMWCLTKPSQVGIITENINNTKRQRVFLCNWFTEASH